MACEQPQRRQLLGITTKFVNSRTSGELGPIIEHLMADGEGQLMTDGWKAYGFIAKKLKIGHEVADHSKSLVNSNGNSTNIVEFANRVS